MAHETVEQPVASSAPRSMFRFSLRTGLLLVIACSIGMYAWAGPSVRQKVAVKSLRSLGFEVEYKPQPTWVPDWVVERLGPDYFCRLASVNSHRINPADAIDQFSQFTYIKCDSQEQCSQYAKLFPNLQTIELFSDFDLEFLNDHQNIDSIYDHSGQEDSFPFLESVRSVQVSNKAGRFDCRRLESFPNLESLFMHTTYSNGDFLKALPKLKTMAIGSFSIAGKQELDFTHIRKLTGLKELFVFGYQITDYAPLYELPELEKLVLKPNAAIKPEGLYEMQGLKELIVSSIAIQIAEVEELRKRLPDCNIQVGR